MTPKARPFEPALTLIKRARMRMLYAGSPTCLFFGSLLLELKLKEEPGLGTMATDGIHLFYDASFVEKFLVEEMELRAVLVHEVMHCALNHFSRKEGRDHELFNVAADLAINPLIAEQSHQGGWMIPKGVIYPGQPPFQDFPTGLTAEAYYALLEERVQKGQGPGECAGKGMGEVRSPGFVPQPGNGRVEHGEDECASLPESMVPGASSSQAVEALAQDWKERMAAAMARASMRGTMPGSLKRMVDEGIQGKADWRRILAEFVSQRFKDERSWRRPDRRHVHAGYWFPGPDGERTGPLAVAIDTSGSIGPEQLAVFQGELEGIAQACGATIYRIDHDHVIQGITKHEPGEPIRLDARGGGGTSHVPVFEWLETHQPEEGDFECLICLTDLYSAFPKKPPAIDTLWCVYGNPRAVAPFGRLAYIDGA